MQAVSEQKLRDIDCCCMLGIALHVYTIFPSEKRPNERHMPLSHGTILEDYLYNLIQHREDKMSSA